MKRRSFVKAVTPAIVLPSFINGFGIKAFAANQKLQQITNAQTETDHVLVLIQLNGGNDGLNTVIPLDQYDKLSNVRSNILIPENTVLNLNGNSTTGLHPSLSGLQSIYNNDNLKIIQSVGYPSPSFSHFRATDIWASASSANQFLTTGWLGRYFETEFEDFPNGYPNTAMPDPLAIQIGYGLPLAFQGINGNTSMEISSEDIFTDWFGGTDTAPNSYAGKELSYIRSIMEQTDAYADQIKNAYNTITLQASYPNNNELAAKLKLVARLIAGGLKTRVYLVSISGFDTHSEQVNNGDTTQGKHANLLSDLSNAIKAFTDDLEFLNLQNRVCGMTFSEFGRRIISNGSLGTDHGAAAPLFIFGKKVKGGILGNNPNIPANVTDEDNIPMQYDFRDIYASILKEWFCADKTVVDNILLNDFEVLDIFNNSCDSTNANNLLTNKQIQLKIAPNPISNACTITFTTLGGNTLIHLFDALGQQINVLTNTNYTAGTYTILFKTNNLTPGNYYFRLQNGKHQIVEPVVIIK